MNGWPFCNLQIFLIINDAIGTCIEEKLASPLLKPGRMSTIFGPAVGPDCLRLWLYRRILIDPKRMDAFS
jgi:hypothetical protein